MLTGKQVVLRPVERDDLKLFHKWKNDEGIMRLGNSYPDSSQSMVMLETSDGVDCRSTPVKDE